MNQNRKQEIITFKVDDALAEALRGVPNRSEFIRDAILSALNNTCPLCRGSGVLTQNQRSHWSSFTENHSVKKCSDCNALYIVCDNKHD